MLKKVKFLYLHSFLLGSLLSLIPNQIDLYVNHNKIEIPFPFISGFLVSSTLFFSPFILVNYFFNLTYIDKYIDKYDFKIQRFHQYDGNNNKYAFPSIIKISIVEF